jgi:hypothetical protein
VDNPIHGTVRFYGESSEAKVQIHWSRPRSSGCHVIIVRHATGASTADSMIRKLSRLGLTGCDVRFDFGPEDGSLWCVVPDWAKLRQKEVKQGSLT